MRLHQNFKNPDDPSDSEFIDDELVEEVEEMENDEDLLDNDARYMQASDSEDDVDNRDADFQLDDDTEGSSEFDEMGENTDETLSNDERDNANKPLVRPKPSTLNKNIQTETSNDGGGTESCGGGRKDGVDNVADITKSIKSSVFELKEEDEDDETVRAIIAAIKKPRSSPPEINLEDFVTDICFHPERDIIAVATISGDVCLYEYSNQKNTLLRTIEVHAKACRDVQFTEDGCYLLTCSKDKSIMVTDVETEKLKKFYENAHEDAINKLHVIDANVFATGDDAGTVKLWDLRMKNEIFGLKEVEDYITQLLTNDVGKLLFATSGGGYLSTINIAARKLYVQSEPYEEELTCMGIYRGDSKLVVGSSKGNLYTFNWGQFGYHSDKFPGVKASMSEMIPITDRIACVAGEEGIIRAVHVAPFRNLGIVGQHTMPIESLDISNNGELIASSSHNNDVRFWNVKYFEDFGDIKYNEKHNAYKEKHHNLPSSKFTNASDFFSDLAKENTDE
uniref:WD repeat-containing protein 55 homolog n=1 Tax=Glossina austeni TaxID=7395 RepID=A0A1A9UN99_GLOAU